MSDAPWLILLMAVLAAYLFRLWWGDYRAARRGSTRPGAFPGASAVTIPWLLVAVAGALCLVAVETAGEYALGVVHEQSTVTALALLGFVAAGFYEELIFRGYIFDDRHGRRRLIASIVAASLLFALLHYGYYLSFPEEGGWGLAFSPKSAWTLLLLFLNSLWFYYLRFSPRNPHRSLLPCFVAHISSNLGVFTVKAAQGYVGGWW